MVSRAENIRSLFLTDGKGLEIGPSHSPLTAKRDGYDVEILDYLDAEGLKRKYAAAGADVSNVEEVDYVVGGRSILDAIGDTERFDWIIASHVVEHVPDLLSFFKDCETLLKPNGVLVLAVPDKRCCFDILRPISTVGQVLQAYVERRRRPPPGMIFDDVAYARVRQDNTGWPMASLHPLMQNRSLEESWGVFQNASDNDAYIDVHCWVFVPSSFRLLIGALSSCGAIGLREKVFKVSDGEFYAVLEKNQKKVGIFDLGEFATLAALEDRKTNL